MYGITASFVRNVHIAASKPRVQKQCYDIYCSKMPLNSVEHGLLHVQAFCDSSWAKTVVPFVIRFDRCRWPHAPSAMTFNNRTVLCIPSLANHANWMRNPIKCTPYSGPPLEALAHSLTNTPWLNSLRMCPIPPIYLHQSSGLRGAWSQ